jgi:hypothetical protein
VSIFRIRSFKEAVRMGRDEREREKAAERAAGGPGAGESVEPEPGRY